MKASQRGFTLLEVSVAIMIMALLAAASVPNLLDEINEKRASVTIQETQSIVDAARKFRLTTGSWPGGATCLTAINVLSGTTPPMLAGVSNTNKYNSAISTSCTAFTFSVDQSVAPDWDGVLANEMPGTVIANPATNTVRTTIGVPGSEPALDSKLSRVATGNAELNRMRTTLLLGGNNITEANSVSANTVTASGQISSGSLVVENNGTIKGMLTAANESQFSGKATFNDVALFNKVVTSGTSCSTKGALARDANGALMNCAGGIWITYGAVKLAQVLGLPNWWPSYIRCKSGVSTRIYYLHLITPQKRIRYSPAGGTSYVEFYDSGAYKTHYLSGDCKNDSVQGLVYTGDAFY